MLLREPFSWGSRSADAAVGDQFHAHRILYSVSLRGNLRVFTPYRSHTWKTPWSVFQDGSVEAILRQNRRNVGRIIIPQAQLWFMATLTAKQTRSSVVKGALISQKDLILSSHGPKNPQSTVYSINALAFDEPKTSILPQLIQNIVST